MADNIFLLDYLQEQSFIELSAFDFYRLIFSEGSLITRTELDLPYDQLRGRYSGIAIELAGNKQYIRSNLITDELDNIDSILSEDNFTIIAPISYAGTTRNKSNARYIYGIAIDLDGVSKRSNIENLFNQIDIKRIPRPTSVVFSGTGLHVYYIFETPYPCFAHYTTLLDEIKTYLTKIIYNGYITSLYDNPQYQSIYQAYRMVGSSTKSGQNKARAFLTGQKVDIEYLISIIEDEFYNGYKIKARKEKLTLEEAEILYPDWYQRRIVEGQPKKKNKYDKTWTCNKGLYNWWLKKLKQEIQVGHRYYGIMCLAIYAKKSGISKEQLEQDAFELVEILDSLTVDEENHFTEDDVRSALEAYKDEYITFPIETISKLTGIEIKKNKRNGLSREDNLEIARMIQNKKDPNKTWINRDGRPVKRRQEVITWRKEHPDGTKSQCKDETGISYPTIRRYWNEVDE